MLCIKVFTVFSLCSYFTFAIDQTDGMLKPNDNVKQISNQTLHLSLISEGGPIVSKNVGTNLSQESETLLSLAKEVDKRPTTSSVVAKKGVTFDLPKDNQTIENHFTEGEIITNNQSKHLDENNLSSAANVSSQNTQINYSNKNTTLNNTTKSPPVTHKKPQILSYEALASMDTGVKHKSPTMKSSLKPVISDQMPIPNSDKVADSNIHSFNTVNHPGMIMPIVITILVVPMFAVLGYMALKRGKEAWKNRHYKRMDFLLDGMYND